MTKSRLLPAGPRPDYLCPYKRVGLAGGGHFLVAWPTLEQQSRIFAVIFKTLRIFHVVFVFFEENTVIDLDWNHRGDPAVVVGNNLQGRLCCLVLNYITNFSIQIARILFPFLAEATVPFHRWSGGFPSSC